MQETLKDIFASVMAILFILTILLTPLWCTKIASYFNDAVVTVYVDGKVVYEGADYLVNVSASRYNDMKEVKIYKNEYQLGLLARYISNDVKVSSKR